MTRPAFGVLLSLFLIFTACEDLNNPATTGVTISPPTASVPKGGTQKFTATVEGTGGPSQEVVWTVEGNNDSGTGIDDKGLLSVAAGESAETLTVKAVSAADPGKSDTAEVTVIKSVQSIAITTPPGKTTYGQGEELDLTGLTVTVTFTDSTKETVAAGNLAVSGYDKDKPGTQTITVTYGGETATFTVTVTAAGTDPTEPGTDTGAYPVVMGGLGYETLEAAIKEAAGTTAAITLMRDIGVSSEITVSAPNTNITLTGGGTNHVITKDNNNESFTFFDLAEGSGAIFTLDKGVTLQGGRVQVRSGAALFLKDGAKITGMTGSGRPVTVYEGGTFTMEGGSIEDNTSTSGGGVYNRGTFIMKDGSISNNTASINGGGVYNAGTFTMEGGSIDNNTASDNGGGVYVTDGGTFIMKGDSIYYNTASKDGGGVYNAGTFTMEGGSIEENSVYADGANIDSASYVCGGGVYNRGTFTMKDGSIFLNHASALDAYAYGGGVYLDSDSVIAKTGGTINGNTVRGRNDNRGAAVYVNCTGNPVNPVRLENDVEADHNLTKATDDDTADELTPANGWTE
jgi:hypothetical protein